MRDSAKLKLACIGASMIVIIFPLILTIAASIRAPSGHFAVAQTKAASPAATEQVQWLE